MWAIEARQLTPDGTSLNVNGQSDCTRSLVRKLLPVPALMLTVLSLSGLIVGSSYLSLTYDKSYAFGTFPLISDDFPDTLNLQRLQDRPIHTSTTILAAVGVILIGWHRVLRLKWRRKPKPQEYTALPLEELRNESPSPRSPRPRSPLPRSPVSPMSPRFANGNGFPKSPKAKLELAPPSSPKQLRITWLLLVGAICGRVKLLQWIVQESQCAGMSYVVRCGNCHRWPRANRPSG